MRISAPPATARSWRASRTGDAASVRASARRHRTTPSGHTWHHPDEVLFRIVREGTAAVVGGGYESDMPGFADVLSDAEIRAVLDYIKSTWPERERTYQENVSQARWR